MNALVSIPSVTLSNQVATTGRTPCARSVYTEAQMNEDRILNKLDEIQAQGSQALVAIGQLQEQIKAVPDHESRIRALEQWRWGLVATSSLLATGFTTYAASKGMQ